MKKILTISLLLGLTAQSLSSCGDQVPKKTEVPSPLPSIETTPSKQASPSPSVSPSAQPNKLVNCEHIEAGGDLSAAQKTLAADLWPWGKAAAWTFTVDEGVAEPYDLLMPELEVFGWRASFFIYTDQPDANTWNRIRLAHERGHEVSNHTLTHPDLTTLSDEKIHEELKLANDVLKRQLGVSKLSLQSFAYPYEATDNRTWGIVKQYHRYARSGDHGADVPPFPINDAHKPNWGELTAKAPTLAYTLQNWNSWVDATVQSGGWFIDELHGVEDSGVTGGWEPRTLDEFRSHFKYIKNHKSGVWVATMGQVGNYIEERENAKFEVKKWHQDGLEFTLEDGFDHPLDYKVPLTFKVTLPKGWSGKSIKAFQNGKALETKGTETGSYRVAAQPDAKMPVCILPAP